MKKILLLLLGAILLTGCQAKTAETLSSGDDSSWEYVQNKGELIIGLDDSFAPMGFRDEAGKLVGFDIDLATAVCEELGIKAKFQPIDWSSKEMELNAKNIDCIWNGMSITPERQEIMSLTRAYLNNKIIVMSVPGIDVNSKEDLKNISVGTQAKSAALEVVESDPIYQEIENFHEYNTYDEVIMDMDAGRVQAMIVDEVLGMYKNSKRAKQLVVSAVDFGDDFYAVGLRKEDKALTEQIQKAIDDLISNGKAAEISNEWFGLDIVVKP